MNQDWSKSDNANGRNKQVNCTAIQGVLIYIRETYSQEYLMQFLDEIDLPYRRLSDKSEWISFEEYKTLLNAFANHADDPNILYEMGKYACNREALGSMWAIFLADFVGLKSTIKKVVENANLFNRISDWEIVKLTHNKFHLRVHWKDGNIPSKHLCHYRQGLFAYLPNMWNGEPAKFTELKCTAKGDKYCEEIYSWKKPPRHQYSLALLLATGVGITIYWLISGHINPLFSLYLLVALLIGKIIDDKLLSLRRDRYTHQQQTELRHTIGELEKKQDELLATNEMANYAYKELFGGEKIESVKTIAAGVAHDLNNLLVGVTGYIDMAVHSLKKNNLHPDASSHLNEASNALTRSRKLTNQLSRISLDNPPSRESIIINDSLHKNIELSLIGAAIECHQDIADDLNPINADEDQLSQVINNVVINACQSMPQGGSLYVTAKNIDIDDTQNTEMNIKEGSYLLISIRDEGVGITPEHLSIIFNPYFTTKESGSGLGLTNSLSIIKKHKGYIFVQSQVGVGSCFNIYLPTEKNSTIDAAKNEDIPIFNHGNILILDDDITVQNVLKGMLSYLGYEVTIAQDGNHAFFFYTESMRKGKPFDAIIIDLILPNTIGGGKTVIKSIKGIDPHVKAIATSGYSYKNVLDHYSEHGFAAAILKPYNLSNLSQILFDVIQDEGEETNEEHPRH